MCWEPLFQPSSEMSYKDNILYLLNLEYSSTIIDALTKPLQIRKNQYLKNARAIDCNELAAAETTNKEKIIANWPVLPDDELLYDCMCAYRKATTWVSAQSCACCSRLNHKSPILDFSLQEFDQTYSPLNMQILVNHDDRFEGHLLFCLNHYKALCLIFRA